LKKLTLEADIMMKMKTRLFLVDYQVYFLLMTMQ